MTNLEFRRLRRQINISFQDDRSGLDPARVIDRASYSFTGRNRLFPITGITTTPQFPSTHAQVSISITNNGRRLRAGRFRFTARSGGIEDLAGNALDGEFTGRFPSGNAQPGGHFVAGLQPPRRIVAVSLHSPRLLRASLFGVEHQPIIR
ncbi:hypothetical protein [Singulisphaera sp. GP187]|uniref:hypothetical protein n=1 Tax=Singulisphaera sp. GP187 TaxID=1882752 RepID=UPI00116128A8|nr:hypothetical protein [Singulisphaera sp. GP187]